VAEPDYYHVKQNGVLQVTAAKGLLLNDFDPDDDAMTVTFYGLASHGSVNVTLDGSFTYVPTSGCVGGDSFIYYTSDGALTTQSTAYIQVTPVPGGQITGINQRDLKLRRPALGDVRH
jgi:hypothetical protein